MPVSYLRSLTGLERNQRANRHLGYALAFNAGAVNAGGFLAVGQYTSHMTGIVSLMADNLALGHIAAVISALVALLTFIVGAMLSTLLINWARRQRLHSTYALALGFEALLLLLFGVMGARLMDDAPFYIPLTVTLLCLIMGCQNAMITKVSQAVIRTTHVTGIVTDIGIELGKLIYWNRSAGPDEDMVHANRDKLRLHITLLVLFFSGGVVGALAFQHFGFTTTIPLALWLLVLAAVPIWDDARRAWLTKRLQGEGGHTVAESRTNTPK